jgi:hypothetical protein
LNRKMNWFSMRKIRIGYFCLCLLLLLFLAGIRSAPVYGKLDFLLLDSKPWWPEWRPMVTEIIGKGTQPVLTDPTTSAVLSGVFGQDTALQRRFHHQPFLYVEHLELLNRPTVGVVPFSAHILLFENDPESKVSVRQTIMDLATDKSIKDNGALAVTVDKEYPFRCVINVHGFTPAWVAGETTHWKPSIAETVWFYRYNGSRGSQLISRLRENPPENCDVFY